MRRLLGLLALQACVAAQSVTRGPSVWQHTDRSFLVAFRTSTRALGAVQWGPTPALGSRRAGRVANDHAITVSGLDPERFYYYRVLVGGRAVTPVHRTRTLPAKGSSDVTFFVFGDCGSGSADQMRVARELERWHADLAILPGDIVYPAGEAKDFDPKFFRPYAGTLRGTPFFPVLGNHDDDTGNGKPFFDAFHLPAGSSLSERWYAFDAGDVHFVGLDSTEYWNPLQLLWLRADLQAARRRGVRWIFAYFHHPPYSSGDHGTHWGTFLLWAPVMEEFEVDAVFCGHDHDYERTNVVRLFRPRKRGVVWFVAGTGGAGIRAVGPPQLYTATAFSKYGFLKVDVRGDVMHTAFIDATPGSTGRELDVWSLARGPVTPGLRARSPHPAPGEVFSGAFDGPAGKPYGLLVATRAGYSPVAGLGIVHLDLSATLPIASGLIGSAGTTPFTLAIPNDGRLRGLDLLLQGIVEGLAAPAGARLTNLLVSTVR